MDNIFETLPYKVARRMKNYTPLVALPLFVLLAAACSNTATTEHSSFTKADSLTETYLTFQDSLYHLWSVLLKDENEKVETMHAVLNHFMVSGLDGYDQLESLKKRLEQLQHIRITQKTLSNPHVIEEYDFECRSLVAEIVSTAETSASFLTDPRSKKLVDQIKFSDQRLADYRLAYDSLAMEYNEFIEKNKSLLKDIDKNSSLQKRPLFNQAADR